jgi:hypothetical protein
MESRTDFQKWGAVRNSNAAEAGAPKLLGASQSLELFNPNVTIGSAILQDKFEDFLQVRLWLVERRRLTVRARYARNGTDVELRFFVIFDIGGECHFDALLYPL